MVNQIKLNKITIIPVRERVASELRNGIFSGSLPPGTELRQDEIAQRLGVSRMPVREAFQMLAGEGLIEFERNRSAVVSNVSADYIKEHFEVRIILECEAVERAFKRIDDFSELKEINKRHKQAIEKNDFASVNLCNLSFHKYIWDSAGNRKLVKILENLWNGFSIGALAVPTVYMRMSNEEHGRIIQAFEEKNPDKARECMHAHLSRNLENLLLRPAIGQKNKNFK